ncbi:nucleotide modification associated domain-containing protein [uncultured Bacteroides sp.]|uniref:nucleotide modification associated domain-containing protein n=1 Tax=uncultured Bacteroides sp. TaxID=162156 RepID=UPI002594067C|nr:nucleotide modification associated domain-containing protein [uncultured Bacteroides sp.]
MNAKVQAHKEICEYLTALYEKKNHDYGDSFHQSFVEGMAMPRIRLGDKFSRFKALTLNGDQQVKDESVRDTLLDLANYAIMTVMEMDMMEKTRKRVAKAKMALNSIYGYSDASKNRPISDDINKAIVKLARSCGIPFQTEDEASDVVVQMNAIIAKSGFASVADLMELTHRDVVSEDSEYGWTNKLMCRPSRYAPDEEYTIPFPELERRQEPRVRIESEIEE